MNKFLAGGAALLATASTAGAVGLDRSNQDIGLIFETGDYAELSYGFVMPSVTGVDAAAFGSGDTGNVAQDYGILGLGYRTDLNEQWSLAIIFDQPYGADISYPAGESVALGGTAADLNSGSVNTILRYKIDQNFSVHGGLRIQSIDANVTLDGAAYGGLAGYNVDLARDTQVGYLVGAAYERPDIALRLAVTYFGEIEHSFDTVENGAASPDTDVTTPQAVNIDFQTGIAEDTLLFGSIRWAEYSEVIVSPAVFSGATGGSSLTDIDDGFAYTIGVGRRFSDQFSGTVSIGYEPEGEDDLVSPLAPTNGNVSLGVGGRYTIDNVELSGGIRYIWTGDAQAETSDTSRATFEDNSAVAIGFQVGYRF